MKKITLAMVMMIISVSSLFAQTSPTATKDVYDFAGFNDKALLDLFYDALQQGRKYPTMAEFETIGIQASDIAFVRSHVRKAQIMDREDRLNKDIAYKNRDLWMNIPTGSGSGGAAGYPSKTFSSDVFSMWQYTNLFGSWNHSLFQAPGCWVDAAHKNGTDIMSGIKFFDTTGNPGGIAATGWMNIITTKDTDGTSFKYVKPLINCLMFFGSDGININWEDGGYDDEDVVAFHKACYKEAYANGFNNFHIGIYTSNSGLNARNSNALFGNSEGRTVDLMLNYSGGNFSYSIPSSVTAAKEAMGTTEGLYAGVWTVKMDRAWSRLLASGAEECNVCLWGEHADSRFWSNTSGGDAYGVQDNYQELLEYGFSGGNRNPANRPDPTNYADWSTLYNFQGLAHYIPERSAIQGNLPFLTHFNLGNGDRYAYKGRKTAGAWYNMATQDIVPTYRWLVYEAGTTTVANNIAPRFSHLDAYTGGTSLRITGNANSAGTDIILYKTNLTVSSSNPVAKVAVKTGKEGVNATGLSVILRKADGSWVEIPYGDAADKAWEEKTLSLPLATGDVIERIGLRVKGGDNYELYVGKLELNDDVQTTPCNVKDVVVEVKEETKISLSTKIYWDVEQGSITAERADWGMLFNDEANIHHFEILYKNGENGSVSEISRTTQWGSYIGDIYFTSESDRPFIGVRSVSTDLKTYSPIVWVEVQRADQSVLPEKEEEDTYGISQINPNAAGYDIACASRFVTDVTTTGAVQDLDYHATSSPADGTQYANARDHVLKVRQGQEITLWMKCFDGTKASPEHLTSTGGSDGLKWCFAGCWLDLDGSGTFNPDPIETNPDRGERIFKLGKDAAATPEFETTGVTHTFTIPNDAAVGTSRMRFVFADAWFAGTFIPTGLTVKGFTIDFTVEILGENPSREPEPDWHDAGTAEEPEMLDPSAINDKTIASDNVSRAVVSNGLIKMQNVEKAWIYTVDGQFVKFLSNNPTSVNTESLAKGVYLVKMMNKNVIRSQKLIVR